MSTPGAAVFCVGGSRLEQQPMSFAPRVTLDLALSNPQHFLGGEDVGLCPEQLDTVIAYQLLLEVEPKSLLSSEHSRMWFEAAVREFFGLLLQPESQEATQRSPDSGWDRGVV